jgi:hypothetical protein
MIFFAIITLFYFFFAIIKTDKTSRNLTNSLFPVKEQDNLLKSNQSNEPKQIDVDSKDLEEDKEEEGVHLRKRSEHLVVAVKFDDEMDEDANGSKDDGGDMESFQNNHDTVWSILKVSLRNKQLRSLMVIYGISSACCNSEALISIMYIQTDWDKGGLGLNADDLVRLSVICFFPSVMILLYSDRVIPKKMSISKFITMIILIFSTFVLLLPFLRDFISHKSQKNYLVIA